MAISLCMIVKNEEQFLGKCLDSVKDIVDEIIVVDSNSSDSTIKIAENFGAKVYQYEWDSNYSNARNFSIRKASGKWILVLDADETIAKRDLERVKALASNKHFEGFFFVQRNYTNNKELQKFVSCENDTYEESKGFSGYFPAIIVRMFRNSPDIFFEREIHEGVEFSILRKGGKLLQVDIPLHHFNELRAKERRDGKIEKYHELSLKRAENPMDAKANFDAGFGFFKKGDFNNAAVHYDKAVQANPGWLDPYFGLGEVYAARKEYEKAIEINKKILGINPNVSAAYYNLGELFKGMKQFAEALKMYEKALELKSPMRDRILEQIRKIKA